LIFSINVRNLDISLLLVIPKKMIPNGYVFSAAMLDGIIRHLDCLIQSNCAQQWPAAMYSASAVERATEFCFFEAQDTKDLPKN
jgi:hypothetical protein